MRIRPGRLTAAVYRYRTEGDTPLRQVFAIGLGLYIGASPFIGLHLALALGLGWLFGLNRFKVYLAANISNPFVAPFLYALEIQIGSWLRTGRFLSAARLDEVRLQGLALDILIGSVVVGVVLAAAGMAVTYWSIRGRHRDPEAWTLVDEAAERYLDVGYGSWELARNKLRRDPVYLQALRDGRLPTSGVLVDLGCGQGLMLSLIVAASDRYGRGEWPDRWPPPPINVSLIGVEARPRVARVAWDVLDAHRDAQIIEGDVSTYPIPPCDAILLFDVLHLLPRAQQDRLLDEAFRAMRTDAVLMIREADAAGGWKFQMVKGGNRLNAIVQGHPWRPFHFDSVAGWTSRLADLGFQIESVTRHDSAAFANFFIQARRR